MADEIRDYDFAAAPVGDDYRRVIELATELSTSIGLVFDDDRHMNARNHRVTTQLRPHLLADERVLDVPGSQFIEPRTRRRYRATGEVARILGTASQDLFGWAYPALPIGPHFLRDDGSAVLTTIEGEDYAYLSLTDDELDHWTASGGHDLRPRRFEPWSMSEWVEWILPELAVMSCVTRDIRWYLQEGPCPVKPVVDEYLRIAAGFESDNSELGLLLEIEAVELDDIGNAEFVAGGGLVNLTVLRTDEPRYELAEDESVVRIASNYADVPGVDVFLHSDPTDPTLWFARLPRGVSLEGPITAWWLR